MSEAREILDNLDRQKKRKKVNRREFLAFGAGLVATFIGMIAAGTGVQKFFVPVVSYLAPTKFRFSKKDLPSPGNEILFSDEKLLLRSRPDGWLGAISLVCTHLGCTVYRVPAGFQCPCHGSQYNETGFVVGGPAPKQLAWLTIKKLPGDEIEIDASSRVIDDTYYQV